MAHESNPRMPGRGKPGQDLWPKWMWIAVPLLVVVVVAGLWWAIFSPTEKAGTAPTPSPTMRIIRPTQPTQAPTLQSTLGPAEVTPTRAEITPTRQLVMPIVSTFTPTPASVVTPTVGATAVPSPALAIGAKVRVAGTQGSPLNMRAGAGTAQAVVKRLPEGARVEIIGGPKDANGFTWWQVRDEAGTTGWVASRYLAP